MKANFAPLGLLVGSLVVALLLAEMTLRLLGVTYPFFYMHDPEHGGQLRSGAMGWWLKEGKSYVRINSDGLCTGTHAHHN